MAFNYSGDSEGGGGTADWIRERDQQKEIEDLIASYTHPATGFGGFGYSPAGKNPLPKRLGQGYGQAAGFILGGSQGAQSELRQQYEAMLRSRAGGTALGYQNSMQRGGAGLAGQGVSPQLAQLLMGGQGASLLSSFGAQAGQDEAGYHGSLAELMKGTGTELAGLKMKELGDSISYLVGKAAADASKTDPLTGLANVATGIGSIGMGWGPGKK